MSRADDIIEGLRREAASRAARSHGHGAGERDRDLGSLLQTGRQLADSMSGHEVPKSTDEGRAFHSSREGLAGREGRAYRTSSYEEERVPPRQARYSRSNRPVRPEEKPVRQASRPQPSRASREAFKRASFLASQRLMRGDFDPFGDDPEPWDPSFVPVPPPESEPPVPEPITHMRAMAHGSSDQGWSYGGFNTLMSMSEGRPVFKAGVAVAPPTCYRFYDTVYTERYMRTPQENEDGYKVNPIERADRLHGALLICHGVADDNVHPQNTFEYSEALVQADKDFKENYYTNRNHGIYGGNTRNHLLRQVADFFQKNL